MRPRTRLRPGLRCGSDVLWLSCAGGFWGDEPGYSLSFYGEDVAFATGPGAYVGCPVEFLRDASGAVSWVRVNGRVARRER